MLKKLRTLNNAFMGALSNGGMLEGIIQMVKRDMTLDFHIRANEVHIYYRGGRVLVVEQKNGSYAASFDTNYCKNNRYEEGLKKLPSKLNTSDDVSLWLDAIPFIKQSIDEHRGESEKLEREYQQHVVRENNNAAMDVATRSDYFIADIEYANVGRCDMVAFKWQTKHRSSPGKRVRLALIEMKFGDKSLGDPSGLVQHVKDVEDLLGGSDNKASFIKEMKGVFKQKRELGIIRSLQGTKENEIHNDNEIEALSDEKPEFILLLAAHSPNSPLLLKILTQMEADGLLPMKNAELKIAVANFTGYSLYDKCMYDLKSFKDTFAEQIGGQGKKL